MILMLGLVVVVVGEDDDGMVRDNNAAPSSQQPAGVVASTQIIAQENIPPTAGKKPKKKITISSEEYQSVKNMIVNHIIAKEHRKPRSRYIGRKTKRHCRVVRQQRRHRHGNGGINARAQGV